MRITDTQQRRFESKIDRSGSCWVWTGARLRHGYATFTIGSRSDGTRRVLMVHRLAYELWCGSIPDDYEIDHLCRNRGCVNPAHLEAVTVSENRRRVQLKHSDQTRARMADARRLWWKRRKVVA